MFQDEELESLVAKKDYDQIRRYVTEKKTEIFQELDDNDREKIQTILDKLQFDINDVSEEASKSEKAFMEIGRLIGICDTVTKLLRNADQNEADLNLFGEEKDLPTDTIPIAEKLYRQGCMTNTELSKEMGLPLDDLMEELKTLENVGMIFVTSAGKFKLLSLTNLGTQYVSEVDRAAKKHFDKVGA